MPTPHDQFFSLVHEHLNQQTLVKLVLGNYLGPITDLVRVQVRPVTIKGQACLSFVHRHQTKDIIKNLPVDEGLKALQSMVGQEFRNAHLLTPSEEIQLAISKKGKATLRFGKSENNESTSQEHNRQKERLLALDRPFLTALGVTDAKQTLIPAMSRKWKQINKFIEVFSSALASSQLAKSPNIHVVDFGSGKGYLTFAIHDYLANSLALNAQVTGVDLKQDMVELGNTAASKLGLQGLRFDHGDVRNYQAGTVNVMIALHACDIATDYAIHMGIRTGADIVMCSPCCHKQIRPQLLSPHPLRPILQHGVHLGQEAEMLTDGLRALLLEACGYDTQVFEFISLEHTNKNKMILATKRASGAPDKAAETLAQIQDIKSFYQIQEHCLESLLKAEGRLPSASSAKTTHSV
ncbi:SAM-dependent methyltransferase [Aquabacterium sp.]|uniref:class I SAM-dependent methyltransferase n=1 Tax=Aquabacterium sp. TaxID=1872578 RepID=UPI0019BF60D6|nr:SAM-dependent methyltransferase [Aquabacterium sp.]MBC7701118.1 SAM-dependent methyltransferase [Aquabacterium sp.]